VPVGIGTQSGQCEGDSRSVLRAAGGVALWALAGLLVFGACSGIDAAIATGVDAAVAPPSGGLRCQAACQLSSPRWAVADIYSSKEARSCRSDWRDPFPLALLAAAAAISLVASSALRWGLSLLRLAGQPAAISLAGALLIFACAVLVARLVVTHRALDHRVAMPAPSVSLGSSPESAVLLASRLSRS
jgi:hypothetical protein